MLAFISSLYLNPFTDNANEFDEGFRKCPVKIFHPSIIKVLNTLEIPSLYNISI